MHNYTHPSIAHKAHSLSCLIGNAGEIDNSHLSPVCVTSVLFSLSPNSLFSSLSLSLPITLHLYQQALDRINRMGGQTGKLQHYGAQGLVKYKPREAVLLTELDTIGFL